MPNVPVPPVSTDPVLAPDPIKIGSFNMQIFGTTKASKRPNTLAVLASIATKFDVLAIQEVGSNNSTSSDETCTTVMNLYLEKVNAIMGGLVYSYVRGNQYAYVYRKDRVSIESYSLYSGSTSFAYTPLVAKFKTTTGNLDFVLIAVHTSPSLANTEIPSLKAAMSEMAALHSEADVICLGDYNADGSYYDEGQIANLNGFEGGGYITGIPNSADTTVGSASLTYDRVQMTGSLNTDYSNNWGVVVFSREYDLALCEGTVNTAGTENAISDHYPVWCEFYVDRDLD